MPYTPTLLTSFVQGELARAAEHIEDAVVYLQLRNLIAAVESFRRATLVMDIVEHYLESAVEDRRVASYQVSIQTTRERIRALSGTILP